MSLGQGRLRYMCCLRVHACLHMYVFTVASRMALAYLLFVQIDRYAPIWQYAARFSDSATVGLTDHLGSIHVLYARVSIYVCMCMC